MVIAIGSDEKTSVTETVTRELESLGHTVHRFGALSEVATPEERRWTSAAETVACRIATGECHQGVLFCWTGTGVCIAANKVAHVRAALCIDAETARGARRWNNANVLVMSLRLTSDALAKEILNAWFSATPDTDAENQACLAALNDIEKRNLK
jgi:ribose 5-phosphate isomerase B